MSKEQYEDLNDIEEIEENVEDELKKLPRESARRVMESISVSKSGPLPDPDDFKKYEETLPGAADRILKMAENEQAKRHELSIKDMTNFHKNSFKITVFGMSAGTVTSITGSISGVLIAIFGKTSSVVVITIILASLLPVIVNALKDLVKEESINKIEENDD